MVLSEHMQIDFYTRYLMLNGMVTIPGIGTFEINRLSARHDVKNDSITAPSFTVRFHANKHDISSNQNAYTKKKLNLSDEDLSAELKSFSELMKGKLERERMLDWPGVGKITYSEGGSIYFEGIRFEHDFLTSQPFVNRNDSDSFIEQNSSDISTVDSSTNDNTEEDVVFKRKDNRWKTTSLILSSLVILILFIRFIFGSYSILQPRYDPIKVSIPSQSYKLN